MSFFDFLMFQKSTLRADGPTIYLQEARWKDFAVWHRLRSENKDFIQPFEPLWPSSKNIKSTYRQWIKESKKPAYKRNNYNFLIFLKKNDRLIGGINLFNVRYGPARMGTLGYWIANEHVNKGYMTQAVEALKDFAFFALSLHRLEAYCMPNNESSRKVLEKAGFTCEGLRSHYLLINNKWEDHLAFATIRDDNID